MTGEGKLLPCSVNFMKTFFWGNDSLADLPRWKKPPLRTSQALHACPSHGSYCSAPWQLKYHFVPYTVNVSWVKNAAESSLSPPSCIASTGLASALLLEGCSHKQHAPSVGKTETQSPQPLSPPHGSYPGKVCGAPRTAAASQGSLSEERVIARPPRRSDRDVCAFFANDRDNVPFCCGYFLVEWLDTWNKLI